MRVAVVGGSGNVGTHVLDALTAAPEVSSVVGISRRLPDRSAEPYRSADWVTIDVGAEAADDAAEEAVVSRLVQAFAGADAVVHLAWLIQPNHDRDLMRRTNVEGTRRVARACAVAGVKQLVCASSWAAYSPVDDDVPRDESWRTGGIRSSHYSVDKAAQERVLDEFEAAHPEVVVTRMRTALIFAADAGAEIGRYFLGPWVPRGLLRPGALPVLPLPAGLRVHVVHAEDAAQAYLQVILQRAGGAFNVTADEVLWPADLARILDHGRYVEISPRLIRPFLDLAWNARVFASDAGWLDMAMGVPVMDGGRIKRVTGWQPRHDAESALRELLEGLVAGGGRASVPMRPQDTQFEGAPSEGASGRARGGRHADPTVTVTGTGETMSADVPPHLDRNLLGIYLSDHLMGASGGVSRIERMAEVYADTDLGPELGRLATEIGAARHELAALIDRLDLPSKPHRQAVAWVAEHVGRLKLNGRLMSRSPLSVVLELEIMRAAVAGQLGLWQTLVDLAPELGLPTEPFEELAESSRGFQTRLERLHEQAREPAFRAGEKIA
ncbi:NAD-dependent epimerase/dehydratase family protein [Georgenia sp. EYE_87]|uniref:NAD-dependent epimerase/dehydratase family protein n=1 Tax=Georgenia sp. EYE_87 TaxID=2853448 RepID=UPI0020039460|nr:NAD-dependent epimerase/dehydratase family protein [Georgenia sp. EYE_87]MCK6211162.1 NAD-dependent epimerase/dehydratase family protein [Georgenia sp. EYE_87]